MFSDLDTKTSRGSEVWDKAKNKLEKDENLCPAHDISHVVRVWKHGMELGKKEGADLEILEPALLLHDIVRPDSSQNDVNHAEESANKAQKMLEDIYTEEELDCIVHAIKSHSRSDVHDEPSTLEAKIVYDADKLDSVGLVGIARACISSGERGRDMVEAAEWYFGRIKDVMENRPFYTPSAKEKVSKKVEKSLKFCEKILGDQVWEKVQR